jgi:hypothetical protein
MKTFSEACESTFLRIGRESEKAAAMIALDASIAPFAELLEEIQNSFEAEGLAVTLLRIGVDEKVVPMDLLRIAFSHGVMVGIEMEKEPLVVLASSSSQAPAAGTVRPGGRLSCILTAADGPPWKQITRDGSPPCFHVEEDGDFCLRTPDWYGHQDGSGRHPFIQLEDLLKEMVSLLVGRSEPPEAAPPTEAK